MIQSTVADTVQIASDMLLKRRDELGLQFKLQNQIHDALMLELPMEEKEICQQLLKECMANIWIPVKDLNTSFKLDIDIDLYERWGVKMH